MVRDPGPVGPSGDPLPDADPTPVAGEPRTEAGRELLRSPQIKEGSGVWAVTRLDILAIEAEARVNAVSEAAQDWMRRAAEAEAQRLTVERLNDERGHTHRHPTGSPFYHDECDITDAPEREAATPPLDVTALAQRIHDDAGYSGPLGSNECDCRERARRMLAEVREYARLAQQDGTGET